MTLTAETSLAEGLNFEPRRTSKIEKSVIDLVGTHKLPLLAMHENKVCF
jgi:hypothetical protein